jgi:hypothetical protein
MPFSALLLTAASSERHITGYGGDRVIMKSDLLSGEVVLFFDKVDSDLVRNSLGMFHTHCCDGVIFRSYYRHIVICLVEMKSDNLGDAEQQIKDTHKHLSEMLKNDCKFCKRDQLDQIIWRAYIYRSGGGPKKDADVCVKNLEKYGFRSGNVAVLGNPDITTFLRSGIKTWNHKKM